MGATAAMGRAFGGAAIALAGKTSQTRPRPNRKNTESPRPARESSLHRWSAAGETRHNAFALVLDEGRHNRVTARHAASDSPSPKTARPCRFL